MDTIVTQYFANKRVFTAQGISFNFSSWQQRFQFMLKGMPLRGTRNFFNAFACIAASNHLSKLIDPLISKDKNPFLHHATTFFLAGVPVSMLITPMDVIYRKALIRINLDTLEVPGYREVCKEILGNGGFKKFFCGAKSTAISTVLAYAVIHATDYGVNQFHHGKTFGCFFAPADKLPNKKIDEQAHKPTTGPK